MRIAADTVKTYRNRTVQFLSWCRERELYPALVTKKNILEYRKHLVDGGKTSPTIRLSLRERVHFPSLKYGSVVGGESN